MPSPVVSKIIAGLTHPATRATAGTIGGAAVGRYVTPKALGYEDNPAAVNMSTALDAIMGGVAGGMGIKGLKAFANKQGPMFGPQLGGAIAGSELVPVTMNLLSNGTNAAKAVAEKPTIQNQLTTMIQSPTAKGIGTGAAAAGLGAILTGLLRPKREGERRSGTSRVGMVKNDLLMYVLPAMVAGGIIGNTMSSKRPSA